jgi:CheY-like chemotaxis protein
VNPSKIVLYADDDVDDRNWVLEACKELKTDLDLTFVDTGRDVLRYLTGADKLPRLIVLDLNMPEMDGKQTLKKLQTEAEFRNIPVAIVTTSSNKLDREVCKRLGAKLYLTKPDTHYEWQSIVKELEKLCA